MPFVMEHELGTDRAVTIIEFLFFSVSSRIVAISVDEAHCVSKW